MRRNYHTHTSRCFHAAGPDEAYVKAALENGFCSIGFSDHTPWPYRGFVSGMRMGEEMLGDYAQSVLALREAYRGRIEILLGLECEYFPQHLPWLREQISRYQIDYIILGHHFSPTEPGGVYNGFLKKPKELLLYRDAVLEALDSGLFSYIAHPDLFMRGYERFDRHAEAVSVSIIRRAIETETPLEYNLLGFHHGESDGKPGYPYPDFWRLAGSMGAEAIIGIDAHQPEAYADHAAFEAAEETLTQWGLRLTDKLNRKW